MRSRRLCEVACCGVLLVGAIETAWAETYVLPVDGDSTIFASILGGSSYDAVSDGGSSLWVATTAGDVARRALLRFDTRALPAGARVRSVRLELTQLRARDAHPVAVHRLLVGWQSAASAAGTAGHGVTALPGDVTWSHRSYPTLAWSQRGGDFHPAPSSSTRVDNLAGQYAWPSTPQLVADVQGWVNNPATNHGFILIGDEVNSQSAKRFAGPDFDDASVTPRLIVEAEPPSLAATSDSDVPLPLWALCGLGGGLFWLLRRRG